VYHKLQGLIGNNLTNHLTDDETHIVINEFKSRMENLFQYRRSQNFTHMRCNFIDLGLDFYSQMVLNEKSAKPINDFTYLLSRLLATRSNLLAVIDRTTFQRSSVHLFCSKLVESVRKPLTKEEISFLIEGLDSRKDAFLIANGGISKKHLKLSELNIVIKGIVFEDSRTNRFTSLLENLVKEKPHIFHFKKPATTSVNDLIIDLKEMIGNGN
jgi:hypothetical protein